MKTHVSVLLYPGCIFFEIALALETLAGRLPIRFYTPDGMPHAASNGTLVAAAGDYDALKNTPAVAVLVPGGDARSILLPDRLASAALQVQMQQGALLAGICAGSLVLAAAGVLAGRRATHNFTLEHVSSDKVAGTSLMWEGVVFERANLVIDANLITAQPWDYRGFAAAVAQYLGVLTPGEAAALASYVQRRMYKEDAPEQARS